MKETAKDGVTLMADAIRKEIADAQATVVTTGNVSDATAQFSKKKPPTPSENTPVAQGNAPKSSENDAGEQNTADGSNADTGENNNGNE